MGDAQSDMGRQDSILDDDLLGTNLVSELEGRRRTDERSELSIKSTQADQAVMEAAMSSAVHHPNIVQTYHYQTLESSPRRPMRVSNLPIVSTFVGLHAYIAPETVCLSWLREIFSVTV